MASPFMKIHCSECKNEQVVFSKPASSVSCVICNAALLKPTGSRAKVRGRVVEVYD